VGGKVLRRSLAGLPATTTARLLLAAGTWVVLEVLAIAMAASAGYGASTLTIRADLGLNCLQRFVS
jgi:hypothetical protein